MPNVHDAEDLFQDLAVVILSEEEGLPAPEDFGRRRRITKRRTADPYPARSDLAKGPTSG